MRSRLGGLAWSVAIPAASFVLLVAAWGLAVSVFEIKPYVLPSPRMTLEAIKDDWDSLGRGSLITGKEFVLGFLIGAGIGFAFALAMSWSRTVQRLIYPVLITSQAVPIIAIAPALVIWMGFGLAPKLTIVAVIVFFPVVVNVLDGLSAVDQDLVALARSMGGKKWKIFRAVTLPATLTPLFSALKMSATFAVTGAVIGEWTASTTGGLGVSLLEAQSRLDTASVFAAIVLLVAMGLCAFGAVAIAEYICTPWRRSERAPRWRRRDHPTDTNGSPS